MPSLVLSVGQCGYDDSRIAQLVQSASQAVLDRASNASDAQRMLGTKTYALVLVNRIFDADGDSGADFIRRMRDSGIKIPMMLVSDYRDAQQVAVEHGALPGFGKSQLNSPATAQMVRSALAVQTPTG